MEHKRKDASPGAPAAPEVAVRVKRVYEDWAPEDGTRVLVDRLWPRGLSKEDARLDEWAKSATPSAELRAWYHERLEERYDEFCARYEAELAEPEPSAALRRLRELARSDRPLTLLTAAKRLGRTHADLLARLVAAP
ncbi:DUF488 domain-containing protein [Streptomyces sp. NPDC059255]|uniref:DUF488 domain-containing protein n=1 Tax=Streptomyces sp. NPDC059255 TaxID=3346793 RepID=UPI0036990A58